MSFVIGFNFLFPLEISNECSTLIVLQLTFYGHAMGKVGVNSKDPCIIGIMCEQKKNHVVTDRL